ncbi:MAG: BON domain-containing protein [Caulobacter sp.]|nr:BON domain-containing protein [Caulobacter sp.]
MADNRNEGWRGRYGWGESTGARGMNGPEQWDGGAGPDNDAVLQGGYREDGSIRGGRGRGGPAAAGHGRGYGLEWSGDAGYEQGGGRQRSGEGHGDHAYGYGPYTPYGRSDGGERARPGRGYDQGQGRRSGESRSFEGHNEYLEAVTDGSDTPGEHRGRGPKGYRRSDDRIREDINDRLTDDSWLDATHIEVAVEGGEVTLTGTVSSRQAKRRAEDIAERVGGVEDVQNNIRVNRQSEVNDQTAASTIAGPQV